MIDQTKIKWMVWMCTHEKVFLIKLIFDHIQKRFLSDNLGGNVADSQTKSVHVFAMVRVCVCMCVLIKSTLKQERWMDFSRLIIWLTDN